MQPRAGFGRNQEYHHEGHEGHEEEKRKEASCNGAISSLFVPFVLLSAIFLFFQQVLALKKPRTIWLKNFYEAKILKKISGLFREFRGRCFVDHGLHR